MGRPKGSKNLFVRGNGLEIEGDVIRVLCRNDSFIVDIGDLDIIQQYTWSLRGEYPGANTREGRGKSKFFILHRLLMNAGPGDEIDHINGDPRDNRRANLRICSHSMNVHNGPMRKTNTTGAVGVSFVKHQKRNRPWHVYIDLDGKRLNKTCETFEQAVTQRHEWELQHNPTGLN